uniref:Uncharacterized protein n=3 Tax=Oryza sativa TaxID=4530 RepID=A0A5S6RDK9_ORYSJ|nr:hypothetical protein [Oryza sativa Japonica Group]AAL79347.1 Unknown protein [Oryza sativa]AAP53275.1 retrotransposon, putative, centromere-specific [Oryza sativa Japonica Group]
MERIQRGEDSRGVDSDCRAAPTSDGRHDFMRTPIWACKTSALVAGLTRTTSSRRPLETVYRLLRRSVFGRL